MCKLAVRVRRLSAIQAGTVGRGGGAGPRPELTSPRVAASTLNALAFMQSDRASVLPAGVLVLRRCPTRDDSRVTSPGSYRVSTVVDRSRFPKLFQFVEWRIDVQLAEVRE